MWVRIRIRWGRQKLDLEFTFRNVTILCNTKVIILCDIRESEWN